MRVSTLRSSVFLFTVFSVEIFATAIKEPRGPIQEAIQNGVAAQYDRKDCIWRRGNDKDSCPDPDVKVYLYTSDRPRRELDSRESDWLRQDYDPIKENVLLIHGYAGSFIFNRIESSSRCNVENRGDTPWSVSVEIYFLFNIIYGI